MELHQFRPKGPVLVNLQLIVTVVCCTGIPTLFIMSEEGEVIINSGQAAVLDDPDGEVSSYSSRNVASTTRERVKIFDICPCLFIGMGHFICS